MKVELIDHMGSDLTVVNSARVSFNKESDWEYQDDVDKAYITVTKGLSERDQKLIKYLASHGHTSPFRHAFAQFRVKAPIFVARQLVKHQVGMSWNEVSRRYVDTEPEFYEPKEWRKRAEDKKQGSGEAFSVEHQEVISRDLERLHSIILNEYEAMLEEGLAPEQARIILPQTLYTEWYWSGSLQAWAHMCNLRCKPDAQQECRELAEMIDKEMERLFPHSWKALRK